MYKYENELNNKKYKLIAGMDEVGRGCIAGPIVCAVVILPTNYQNHNINDSKLLTSKKREQLSKEILDVAIDYHIEVIATEIVDKLNPKEATRYGMIQSLKKIKTKPDFVLIDFEKIPTTIPNISITKGDQKSISIAAASIIAKVYRDNLMQSLHNQFPLYDLSNNKGYLTKKHYEAILNYGPNPKIHRYTYKPIKGQYTCAK